MLTDSTEIYEHLVNYLIETNQLGFATRYDCVAYCVGYFGGVTAPYMEAINTLHKNGMVKA